MFTSLKGFKITMLMDLEHHNHLSLRFVFMKTLAKANFVTLDSNISKGMHCTGILLPYEVATGSCLFNIQLLRSNISIHLELLLLLNAPPT